MLKAAITLDLFCLVMQLLALLGAKSILTVNISGSVVQHKAPNFISI